MYSGKVLSLLRSMLRFAAVTLAGGNEGDLPVQQVTYLGKTGDAAIWHPYGLHANLPEDTLVIIGSIQGDPGNRVAWATSGKDRPDLEKKGEVVLFHPESGARVHMKSDGSIEIISSVGITITGDLTVTGDTIMSGDLTADGDVVGGTVKTAGGKDLDTHVHIGSATAPTGGISNTGAPV